MDDGILGDEMTLDGIGRQLAAIQRDLATVTDDVSGLRQGLATTRDELRGEIASVRTEIIDTREELRGQMPSVLDRVDGLAHTMHVRFDQTQAQIRFGLEAREALRETTERGFAETRRRHDEEIALLKQVLRAS